MANSGAILYLPGSHFEWIRPGVMLYGGSPTGVTDTRLQAAMTLSAPVIAVNNVAAGEAVGYGGSWRARPVLPWWASVMPMAIREKCPKDPRY